jgi:hypothetical protein
MSVPFEKSFASNWRSSYWSTKNIENPKDVYKYSNKKYWFMCTECNHHFEAIISNIVNGQWCSYCKGDKLCESSECSFCFNKSVASCEKAKYWSVINNISPRFVLKGSNKTYFFECDKCTHTFNLIVNKLSTENAWCPYCINKLCNDFDCKICYNNSFACHPKSKYWSNDNILMPRNVRTSSIKKYVFNCDKCNHSFSSSLNNIIKGTWCPYCCINSIKLCDNNNCIRCYEKSFASSELSKYWSANNKINPRNVFKKTDKKYIFNCDKCNLIFSKRLLSIAYGGWCPYCKNKSEKKLYTWLLNQYNNIIYQPKYDWCINTKTNRQLPFDFEYKNIIIELDGPQHFKQISNWRTPEEQNELDKYKMDCAIKNNKHIIRILQTYIFNDEIRWKDILNATINELLFTSKPSIKYIGVDPMYFE